MGSRGASALGLKTGLSSLGYVTAAAGALQGGINLAQNIGDWNNQITTSDLQENSGRSTGVINGRLYDRIEGYDKEGMNNYLRQMNNKDMWGTIGSSMQIGSSVGSLFGPIGSGIGAGIGALGGWIGSLIGRNNRKDALRKAQAQWDVTRDAYNTQSEAAAASQGVLDDFYARHGYGAKRGKSSHGGMYGKAKNS